MKECADCRKALVHANSDATTPGFFYDKCEKHRGKIWPSPNETVLLVALHDVTTRLQAVDDADVTAGEHVGAYESIGRARQVMAKFVRKGW